MVVELMGLLDQVRAMTVTQQGIAWVDAAGRHRAEMPVEAFGGRGIVSADEILRGDLATILYEAARPGVSYLFDESITALEQDADSVLVSFEKIAPAVLILWSAPTGCFQWFGGWHSTLSNSSLSRH
jgi:2-polyprenyl-6-methoxyphenol hydroxylase-like FAD-dependent oxidoreductase